MTLQKTGEPWNVSPRLPNPSRFAWDRGAFATGVRDYTDHVEGTLCSPNHLLLVTLRGGARRYRIKTACGHRYEGSDRAGSISFLPAHCERQLRLESVAWEWASIALRPDLPPAGEEGTQRLARLTAFSDADDPFLLGLVSEFHRLHALDGRLDPTYCDTMILALVHYLDRRYGEARTERNAAKLPPWRLRRLADYVDAHLDQEIRIPALAALVGLSEGHLHRAFRLTTGRTPLQYVTEKRIQRATELLARESIQVTLLAHKVGFGSPSHFARVFRSLTGVGPSQYRRALDRRPIVSR